MITRTTWLAGVLAWLFAGWAVTPSAQAQTVVLNDVRTLSSGSQPVVRSFTVAAPGTYRLMLSDLAVPAAFASLNAAVIRGNTLLAARSGAGSIDFDVTTAGDHELRITGVPAAGAGAGSFGVRVVHPAAGDAVVIEFADAFSTPATQPSNRATLDLTFDIATAGTYEVQLADHAFPSALTTATLAVLREGGGALEVQLAAPGTATFVASPGQYRLLAIGEAGASLGAGAFGVRVRLSGSPSAVVDVTQPVGNVRALTVPPLAAGGHDLMLADLGFPAPLTRSGALVTRGSVVVARRDTPGTAPFSATAGAHQLWVVAVATPALPGSFGLELREGQTTVVSTVDTAPATGASSGTLAFHHVVRIPAAGSYRLRLTDFQFPQAFATLGMAATQGGVLLESSNTAGTLTLNTVAAGDLFVVVLAQPAAGATPSGLLGIDLAAASGGAAPLLERIEAVGAMFHTYAATITTAGEYEVTLSDLEFPARFGDLAAVVTRGSERSGSVFSGGTFGFPATPGTYQVTVIAQPAAAARYGTYALRVATRPAAPTVTFSADVNNVPNGGTAMLNWSSSNADDCQASGGWSGARAVSGSERTAAITSNTTFTLNCRGPGGERSASVTISPQSTGGASGGGGKGGGRIDIVLLVLLAAVLCLHRVTRRGARVRLALAGLVACAGAAQAADVVVSAVTQTAPTPSAVADDHEYRIQPGDILYVAVWKERDLQGEILVRPDGGISFPLAGDVAAGGRTVVQLGNELGAKLRRYIPDPVVTVAVKSIGGNRVYVLGKVNRPGEFAFSKPVDVMQALALAGGATSFAAVNDIRILRRTGDRLVALEFHYADVERGRKLEQNILLRSGDTVVVP